MTDARWEWNIPLGAIGAALVASDTAIEQHVPPTRQQSPMPIRHPTPAVQPWRGSAGMFLWGHATHDDQKCEKDSSVVKRG
ncbi:MAG: hypothetical protein WAU50_00685, partial [Candidatus Sulfotelmatobacter sp.]